MSARVLSVQVGVPLNADWAGKLRRTAIRKHPVAGPVAVGSLGIKGDQVADTKHHGGIYQAVYAFAREDLDLWGERLGMRVPNGQFGENITTEGIDVNEALLGELWRVGTTIFEVIDIRIPCNVFKGYLGVSGFDSAKWIKRFTAEARPGPYLRVAEEGHIAAGDTIEVVHRPNHDVTVSMMFKAFTTDRALLPRLLDLDIALAPGVLAAAQGYLAKV